MPAPTALQRKPDALADAHAIPLPEDRDDEILADYEPEHSHEHVITSASAVAFLDNETEEDSAMRIDEEGHPKFAPTAQNLDSPKMRDERKISIPPHRMTPLKNSWSKIYPPLVEFLKLQVRMNTKKFRAVELRTSPQTTDAGALQKGEDFIKAFALGFDVDDALALLRLDDIFVETFEIKDVKTLTGDGLSRAIGRIAGKDGKTRYAIENATRTRLVVAGDSNKIHILGGFKNIQLARHAVVSLILGSQPGKVYNNLRKVSARMKERF